MPKSVKNTEEKVRDKRRTRSSSSRTTSTKSSPSTSSGQEEEQGSWNSALLEVQLIPENCSVPSREKRRVAPNKKYVNDNNIYHTSTGSTSSESSDGAETELTSGSGIKLCNSKKQEPSATGTASASNEIEILSDHEEANDATTIESLLMLSEIIGTPFLQHFACWRVRGLDKCLDCLDAGTDTELCRFFNFRKLCYDMVSHTMNIVGFADPVVDPNEEDIQFWLPSTNSENVLDLDTARFIHEEVREQFQALIQAEADAETICHVRESKIFSDPYDLDGKMKTPSKWKRKTPMVREMCDVCVTTIFNYHWACATCGFVVCVTCKEDRERHSTKQTFDECLSTLKAKNDQGRRDRDVYRWLVCWNNALDREEPIHNLLFVQFIPVRVWDDIMTWNCNTLMVSMTTHTDSEVVSSPPKRQKFTGDEYHLDDESSSDDDIANEELRSILCDNRPIPRPISEQKVPHDWFCDGMLLHLKNPKDPKNGAMFSRVWKLGQPVLVSGLHKTLSNKLWSPKAFEKSAGGKTHELVNIATGLSFVDSLLTFWQGFENINARMRNERGEPVLLKLKDWPPRDDLANAFPERFEDLMKNLPLPEYTLRDGKYNLAARLPETFLKPDLGPKMYIAYASPHNADLGTTNLHLDMSDATNVMTYVGIPKEGGRPIPNEWEALMKVIKEERFDAKQTARVQLGKGIPGAIWHIYHKEDSSKIREYLRQHSIDAGETLPERSDPIHDQRFYLDLHMRQGLKAKYNVVGYSIIQCMGDAVFIPAGAPHQVRNIRSCIKIAEDYVSPENLSNCFELTEEFRQLSENHGNHEDKLQIKNITFHAMKDALSVLRAHGVGIHKD